MLRKLILPTLLLCGQFLSFTTIQAQCVSGDCNNGFGTAIFKKKGYAKYTGAFKNRRPHGSGSAVYRNGRRYDGQWSEGMWHGEGTLMLTDGTELIGSWAFSRYQGASKIAQTETLTASTDSDIVETTPSVSEAVLDKKLVEKSEEKEEITEETPTELQKNPESAQKNEVMPEIWAVAVGVATYDDVNIPALKYPDNDAWSMYAFWKSPAGGMLDDAHSEILVDDRATKKDITTTMRKVFTKAQERDLAIFFFSGHGLRGSFLPSDYDGESVMVQHEEVNQILSTCTAKNKLVIADACHSGSYVATKGIKSARQVIEDGAQLYEELNKTQPGTAYLLSSLAEEESLEVSSLQNSVFTYFILRGLKGEANKNNDNIVTIKELFDFVSVNVSSYAQSLGKKQTPVLKGDFDPEMPVAIVRK